MRVVILAGGLGTRLQEETTVKPKPMVEIGGRPILWHIMKHYAHYGLREFVVALGYKGECDQAPLSRLLVDQRQPDASTWPPARSSRTQRECEDWLVHLVDTGDETNTGGRIRRLRRWLDAARSWSPTATAWATSTCKALLRFHQRARPDRHDHGRPPAGPLRRRDFRRRHGGPLHRKAASRRRLDQRRLPGARAGNLRLSRRRREQPGSRTPSSVWPPTGNWPRIGTTASGSAWIRCATRSIWNRCGRRQSALEGVDMSDAEACRRQRKPAEPRRRPKPPCNAGSTSLRKISGSIGRSSSPAARAWWACGWSSDCVAAGAEVVCLVRDWVPQSELIAPGLIERSAHRSRRRLRPDAAGAGAGRIRNRHGLHLAAQAIVGVANANPVSTFEATSPAPGRCWKPAAAARA